MIRRASSRAEARAATPGARAVSAAAACWAAPQAMLVRSRPLRLWMITPHAWAGSRGAAVARDAHAPTASRPLTTDVTRRGVGGAISSLRVAAVLNLHTPTLDLGNNSFRILLRHVGVNRDYPLD